MLLPPLLVTTLVVEPMFPAKLRRCSVRQDTELRDRVDRDAQRKTSVHPIDILSAIEEEVVRLGSCSVHDVRLAGAKRTTFGQQPRIDRRNPRLQQS